MDDGHNLFDNTYHGNRPADPQGITRENVSEMRLAMRKLTSLDDETLIDVQPVWLVVSPELESAAEQFIEPYSAQFWDETNPYAKKLKLIVEPRLDPYDWYLFADPAKAPVLELAKLAGREAPQIESQQAWDTWGVSFRCIHHVGAAAIGWRGAAYLTSPAMAESEV